MAVRRYDIGEYRKPTKTPEGFLKADGLIARTGVQSYRQADGSVRRELRLPDEVFAKDALASFADKVITDDHPDDPVTAANAGELSRGHVGDNVRRDGGFVLAPLTITDADLVQKVESGKVQLSCGYDCELEMTPGEWNGERYDAIQRNIRGNHVAVVDRGRAGPDVRVRLDAADAVQVANAPDRREPTVNRKIRIDGVEYEVSEQVAQAFEKMQKAHADGLSASRAELAVKVTELEKATARADTAEASMKKADKARTDAEDPKRMDALVNARVSLITEAREVLGDTFKADGLDEQGIRKAVLAKLAPELKLDGRSADYVTARYDGEVERFQASGSGISRLREVVSPPPPTRRGDKLIDKGGSLKEHVDAFHEHVEGLWQKPLTKQGARLKDR